MQQLKRDMIAVIHSGWTYTEDIYWKDRLLFVASCSSAGTPQDIKTARLQSQLDSQADLLNGANTKLLSLEAQYSGNRTDRREWQISWGIVHEDLDHIHGKLSKLAKESVELCTMDVVTSLLKFGPSANEDVLLRQPG